MRNLSKLALSTAIAAMAIALTAGAASADIYSGASGTYVGPIKGVNTGPDPTFQAGSTTITCTHAPMSGEMDGDWDATGPASAVADFSWDGCATNGGSPCTFSAVEDMSLAITEENAPDATIVNTEAWGMDYVCGSVIQCHVSSDPTTSPVTADFDSDTQIASINDVLEISGHIGCPGQGDWIAQYLITDEDGASLDLFATGAP
jgi:hypothetical protein